MIPLLAWVLAYLGYVYTPGEFSPTYWHGHEMIFGFVIAAVAGFLLTAVPNWTRTGQFCGRPLVVLALIWLAGRLAMWFGGPLGPEFVAFVDLAMIPVLALYIGKRLIAHRARRNYIVLGLLGMLFAANVLMHLEAMQILPDSAELGINLAIYVVVFLVTMISGRVIPGFTANALRRRGVDANIQIPKPVTIMLVISMILTILVDLFAGDGMVARQSAGLLAGLCALILIIRMVRWKTLSILGDPLVWVLHMGHFWLAIGFALMAMANLNEGVERAAALHALSAGAMGTMVLGMMSRIALGHSGRELKVSKAIVVAYLMVIAGATLRVVAAIDPGQLPGDSLGYLIGAAGLLWAGGFAIFSIVYWPVLTRPRI